MRARETAGPHAIAQVIVIMGVSGCGKSSVGTALAQRMDTCFLDADDFHPPGNLNKMSRGQPLIDEDRWQWLDLLGKAIAKNTSDGHTVVTACSALRQVYRDRLVSAIGSPVLFVYLEGDRNTIAERLSTRTNHFMPEALLISQLDTLEPPTDGENYIIVRIGPSIEELVNDIHQTICR